MAIWKPEDSGCRENPGVFDIGGRICSRYVSSACPGVVRIVTTSYPYGQSGPDRVTYEYDGHPITADRARAQLAYGETLEPEAWLVGSDRAIIDRRVCIGELSEAAAESLELVASVRDIRLVRCRQPRVSPQQPGGYAEWREGDPAKADRGVSCVGYDASGDPVALLAGCVGETIEAVRRRLRARIAAIRQEATARQGYAASVQAERDRLRPLFEQAMALVPIARRTGRADRGKAHTVQAAYDSACEGYDYDRRHWEGVLTRLASGGSVPDVVTI